ncbi:hypothetical protein MTHERMOG20_23160 [Moorella thermoacetica]|uniref:Uncharacterized protein n=1 Tax=Moorella thermoacetica (strain ATCC 39073 / JCM 9320) TaxID=264732 RepID=Q2RLN7_MOOTA|nr:hypothetical protein [Moorella thermoacetica]AKX95705.1 hypothetical protein MOTHA_c03360 [Moorella thermoacetica]OIQ54539.1 hypothetical protein MOCA_22080 [Moorella thermoacetica]QCZ99515.1 hypothetical protein MothHH_00345 [Moorella thermoacetica]TYL07174.1 hypothetical protein MOOCA_22820 [Moorella thermoacetica]TYL07541.1 hypothetical protein MOLA_22020 [Moorella thermoacetica]
MAITYRDLNYNNRLLDMETKSLTGKGYGNTITRDAFPTYNINYEFTIVTPYLAEEGHQTMKNNELNTIKPWDIYYASLPKLLEQQKEENEHLKKALISFKEKECGGNRIKAILELYKQRLLYTSDVLKFGGLSYDEFLDLINENQIPYQYEDDFTDDIEGFDELL